MNRELTESERDVIVKVAERLPEGARLQLLNDLRLASVSPEASSDSRIVFTLADYERPPYVGQRSLGVEGQLLDSDGARITVDVYADQGGRLLEIELVRWGDGHVIAPDWNTLKLY